MLRWQGKCECRRYLCYFPWFFFLCLSFSRFWRLKITFELVLSSVVISCVSRYVRYPTQICYFVNRISEAFRYFLQVIRTNLCGNKHVCLLNSYIRHLQVCILRTCHMTRGDEPCCIFSPFRSSVKFSVVGVCKSGLKVSFRVSLGTSLVNLRFLERESGKQLWMGWSGRNRSVAKIV